MTVLRRKDRDNESARISPQRETFSDTMERLLLFPTIVCYRPISILGSKGSLVVAESAISEFTIVRSCIVKIMNSADCGVLRNKI